MRAPTLLLLATLSACAAGRPHEPDCKGELVPINPPTDTRLAVHAEDDVVGRTAPPVRALDEMEQGNDQ